MLTGLCLHTLLAVSRLVYAWGFQNIPHQVGILHSSCARFQLACNLTNLIAVCLRHILTTHCLHMRLQVCNLCSYVFALSKPEATSCDVGVPSEIPLDKTARKVAELAQLVQGSPPSFSDLEAFLFREPDVKLPVLDAKYYSLVAANEGLVSQIEPASKSGAEALATVVTTALSMQYEPVADETSLAGVHLTASSCKAWLCPTCPV